MRIIIHPRFAIKRTARQPYLQLFSRHRRTLTVSTMTSGFCVVLAVCLAMCANAQPVSQAPVLKEAPQEVLFRVKEALVLECLVEGDDSGLTYEWTKNDIPMERADKVAQNGGKLVFGEPKNEDEGDYQCIVSSEYGKATSRSISVRRSYLDAPKVTPQTIKPVEGKPFKLECKMPKAYPEPTIEWLKKTKEGNTTRVADGRITISPEGDLYFSNATQNDVSTDFKYICVAKSPAVDDEVLLAEYTVEPLEANPNPDNEVVKQFATVDGYTLEAGKQAYLYCIYGGSPLAHPDWFKDGVNVNNSPGDRVTRYNRSKGKRLLIREVLLEDQGEYTCVINNEVGKEQKYVFRVEVVSVPKFLKKPEKRMQAKEGSDVFIPCEVQSKPTAKSVWSFNAAPLSSTHAKPDAKGLTISKVQKGDSGYYGCAAENGLGEDYVETFLQVA